ncbi:MAG TPA: FKBP-type peptidyl-prolyl cis-trans isomerase [Thermoanaerobaculia bacterium]|jgi:FKBP-type peptidyl-prolyl cis-trans isomerase|nr:FKBP-type peptidyl-prolyl cis-trans isomerase [Thermoanaerobaculia bacterium]
MTRKHISFATVAFVAALIGPALAAEAPARGAPAAKAAPPATTVPVDAQLQLQSEQQKTLYALGLALAQSLDRLNLQESEVAYLLHGFEDGVLGRSPKVSLDEYGPKVQALGKERVAAAAERERTKARDFLAKMAGEPGARKTDSGIIIFAEQEGTGPNPKKTDTVRVNYEGKLPDGTVFDSSIRRGQPASFALDRVIPCWAEALQAMKVGGKARIVCPPELAYGAEGRPGIPPNSPLVFEVHLLGIGDAATAAPGKGAAEHQPLMQEKARR